MISEVESDDAIVGKSQFLAVDAWRLLLGCPTGTHCVNHGNTGSIDSTVGKLEALSIAIQIIF